MPVEEDPLWVYLQESNGIMPRATTTQIWKKVMDRRPPWFMGLAIVIPKGSTHLLLICVPFRVLNSNPLSVSLCHSTLKETHKTQGLCMRSKGPMLYAYWWSLMYHTMVPVHTIAKAFFIFSAIYLMAFVVWFTSNMGPAGVKCKCVAPSFGSLPRFPFTT